MSNEALASEHARVRRPERFQVEMQLMSLDQMLPADHQARIVWQYVKGLDLEPLYQQIKVSDSQCGRSATDPAILVALWLLATLDGIGSARELNRRCGEQVPYMWICGGVGVNYHTLSDFRVAHDELLNSILTDSIASLIDRDLVSLDTLAQDGMRVRANAGSSSFRRKPTLEKLQKEAAAHVEQLKKENEDERVRTESERRRDAARRRAAEDRKRRVDEALKQREKLAEQREKRQKGDGERTRVSTTDPDARKMKMANGGYDPALNVQFVCDGDSRLIVSVGVTNQGTDSGLLAPAMEEVRSNYDCNPSYALVDAAYATANDVTQVEKAGTKVVSTVPRAEQMQRRGKDPHSRQPNDSDQYADFRARMATPEYQEFYKQRPSIAEFPNADCRNRQLRQFPVRGLRKATAIALWHALAFNFRRMRNLGFLMT